MSPNEIQQLEQLVHEKISELTAEISELEELTKPVPLDASIGRVSRMDAINNKSINEAALREKRKLITRLERTLERINEKDFGLCTKCGQAIPFGRLEYMPHTTRCVHCVA
ncbi:MAG: TraR/DksA family transcriptional regulator [Balneolaceae bacterium]|nr:TraR/DksA family transcriptional regulator [Balneolaceae bacterium]